MKRIGIGLFLALMFGVGGLASAQNTVVVESMCVDPGATDVVVGIFLDNDLPITGIVLPVEIRSLKGNAFTAGQFDVSIQGRLMPWQRGSAFKVLRKLGKQSPALDSKSCLSSDPRLNWFSSDSTVDFASPDAFLYAAVGMEPAEIPAGKDGPPGQGTPSVALTFNVNAASGSFVIDTVCIPPGNHLVFVANHGGNKSEVVPKFTRGEITIGCK